MLIGIDGNEANQKVRVGVGQYAFNLLTELAALDKANSYIVYLRQPPLPDMPAPGPNWTYKVFGPQKLWTKIALPLRLFLQKEKLDYFYTPSHYSPHFSPFKTIPTIHDLGYLDSQSQFTKKDIYQLVHWTKHSLDHAFHIIAVSEFTKSEINRIYGIPLHKISVVYNGVGEIPPTTKSDTAKTLQKFSIKKPYFLYLGTLKPNKNIPYLIKAYSQYLKNKPGSPTQLVIAGKKGWLFDDIFSTVVKEKVESKVIFTDYISETEKWALIKNCQTFILPSTYEGFGIPVLEAIKCHVPVIGSNLPPIKEVAKDSICYIDPLDIDSLVKALIGSEAKVNPQLYKDISNRFSWKNAAQSLSDLFNRLNS